jgi:hypothetical protein
LARFILLPCVWAGKRTPSAKQRGSLTSCYLILTLPQGRGQWTTSPSSIGPRGTKPSSGVSHGPGTCDSVPRPTNPKRTRTTRTRLIIPPGLMQRPIKPEWLIRLARELAGEGAGQGQPRNTNLRRATSSAYYGLFHTITLAISGEALPNASADEPYGYARYVNHTAVKEVCEWISGNQPPEHLKNVINRLRNNGSLSAVASAFVALHEQREAADYDHLADFTRPGTLALVGRSESARAAIEATANDDDFRAFFGLIGLQTNIRRR